MTVKTLKILLLLCCTAVCSFFIGCSTDVAGASEVVGKGGSEVIGTLVRPDNTPLVNQEVQALAITSRDSSNSTLFDTTIVKTTITDHNGDFTFDSLPFAEYTLYVPYPEDSLIIPKVTFYPDTTERFNLDVIIMLVPGAITGTVQVEGKTFTSPIWCYIKGTSYNATADSAGSFSISSIPPDTTYSVTISTNGYLPQTIKNISVFAGQETTIDTQIILIYDPKGPLPTPELLSVTYDTLAGAATLTWNHLHVEDIERYIVYTEIKASVTSDTVHDTIFTGNIFEDASDTLPKTAVFQVAALDNDNNTSQRSGTLDLVATPPSWLGFTLSLTQGELTTSPDSIPVIIRYNGKIRSIVHINWWIDSIDSIVRSISVDSLVSGADTLFWKPRSDKNFLGVSLTDNAQTIWKDSMNAASLLPVDVWSIADSLNEERRYAGACVIDETIYVFGGCKEKSNLTGVYLGGLKSTEKFDPATETWVQCASMNHPRFNAAYTCVDNKIYIFGGTSGTPNLQDVENTFEVYDSDLDTWTLYPMEQSLIGAAAAYINGSIIISGGMTGTFDSTVVLNTIITYNPDDSSWNTVGTMQYPRLLHKAVVVDNTSILFVGGINYTSPFDDQKPVPRSEYVQYQQSSFTSGLHEITIRNGCFRFGAVQVNNNLITIGGLRSGALDDTSYNTVDIYSITSGQVSSGSTLNTGIEGTAVVYCRNRVFCIGGSVETSSTQKSSKAVYVYYP